MIIGCTLPLLLIFLAPYFGLGENVSLFIFILAMFACHLMMPMHYGHKHESNKKEENHESHSR
jgi:hypothetical protein